MILRVLTLLAAMSPWCLHAQQDRVVLTQEAHAELQAFAEKNGYKSLSAAYADFLEASAVQKKETEKKIEEMRKEGESLAVSLQHVEAKLSNERTHLALLQLQRAAESDFSTRMLISERINRSEGRIELLEIERESLQKQLEDAQRAATSSD